jgi:hypothetical protein
LSRDAWIASCLALLVLVVGLVIFSKRRGGSKKSKAQVKGPFGMSVRAESSSEVTPGIKIDGAISEAGGLTAEDQTGRGVDARKIQTKTDISLTNVLPRNKEESADPKQ